MFSTGKSKEGHSRAHHPLPHPGGSQEKEVIHSRSKITHLNSLLSPVGRGDSSSECRGSGTFTRILRKGKISY